MNPKPIVVINVNSENINKKENSYPRLIKALETIRKMLCIDYHVLITIDNILDIKTSNESYNIEIEDDNFDDLIEKIKAKKEEDKK